MLFRADFDNKLKLKHLYQVSPETDSWERLTPHSSDRVRVLKPFHPYKQLESKSLPTATVLILQLKNKQTSKKHTWGLEVKGQTWRCSSWTFNWRHHHYRFHRPSLLIPIDVVYVQTEEVLLFVCFFYLCGLKCNLGIISRWLQRECSTSNIQQTGWLAKKYQLV